MTARRLPRSLRPTRQTSKDCTMNNRYFQNGLLLAGALVVLFSLMFATSVAVSRVPVGL